MQQMRARQYPCWSHPASDLLLSARKLHPFTQAPQQHDSGSNPGFKNTYARCWIVVWKTAWAHAVLILQQYLACGLLYLYAAHPSVRRQLKVNYINRGSSLAQQNSAGLLPSYAVSTDLLYLHTSRCGDGTLFPLSLVVIHHSHSLLWW